MANPYSLLFDYVGVMARRRYQIGERRFATLGLNHTEARLLSLLSQQGGKASQDALSNMLSVDRSNAGRALQSLERSDYVVRGDDAADRRTKSVQITKKGREAAAEISRLREEMAQSFFGTLTEEQAGEIASLLNGAMRLDPSGEPAPERSADDQEGA